MGLALPHYGLLDFKLGHLSLNVPFGERLDLWNQYIELLFGDFFFQHFNLFFAGVFLVVSTKSDVTSAMLEIGVHLHEGSKLLSGTDDSEGL